MRTFVWAVAVFAVIALTAPGNARDWRVSEPRGTVGRTFREMRYDGVVGQTSWVTCGPAAVATLLSHYLDQRVSERDIVMVIEALNSQDAPAGHVASSGYTLLDLKRALHVYGVDSVGLNVEIGALRAYFEQGGHPVIVHLTRPQLHFVVAVGSVGSELVVADPSFGRRSIPWGLLDAHYGYVGNTLVPLLADDRLELALRRQQAALESAAAVRAQLERLGRAI